MIGQTKLHDTIERTIDRFPKFSIFAGPKGSGKKTIVKEVFKMRLMFMRHSYLLPLNY